MIAVILARPENQENLGLAARAMKNTGFRDLRLTGVRRIGVKAFKTAVHSEDLLMDSRRFPDLDAAVADLDVVFAATAKARSNFPSLPFSEAMEKILALPAATKVGLLFGNERTGLTSEEMQRSNFRFTIPQAARQPSYNLASAVLLTLFRLFSAAVPAPEGRRGPFLSRAEQDACIRRILDVLAARRFMHDDNRGHVTEMIFELFGRLVLTPKDRNLLLAIFHKGAAAGTAAPHPAAAETPRKES